MKIDKEKISRNVFKISDILTSNGFSAYLVGGAVRDIILGQTPNDYDILTDAPFDVIKQLFKNIIPYGLKHGTVIVVINKTPYEVSSLNEGTHKTSKFENDILKRDFTINALACDLKNLELIDIVGGYDDCIKQLIRCVGSPYDRFLEDPLRMLRAIRFSATLKFNIEENTFNCITKMANDILKCASERINTEIIKMFNAKDFNIEKVFSYFINSNLWNIIFNFYFDIFSSDNSGIKLDFNFYDAFKIIDHLNYIEKFSLFLAYSLFWKYDKFKIDYEQYKLILKKLLNFKFDRTDSELISILICNLFNNFKNNIFNDISSFKIKKMLIDIHKISNKKICPVKLILLNQAFLKSVTNYNDKIFKNALYYAEEFKNSNDPIYIEDLEINGNDIIDLFSIDEKNKVIVGKILNYLQMEIIKDKSLNKKEKLIELATNYYNQIKT